MIADYLEQAWQNDQKKKKKAQTKETGLFILWAEAQKQSKS